MAFPHPQSRQDEDRDRDKPNYGSVVRQVFKRTINISGYRNGKDDVNPAQNRAFGGIGHDCFVNLFVDDCKARLEPKRTV